MILFDSVLLLSAQFVIADVTYYVSLKSSPHYQTDMSSNIPGPRPWPLIGNLLNIDLENSVQSVVDIGKQYGKAMGEFRVL